MRMRGIYTLRGVLVGLWCHKWVEPADFATTARIQFDVHVELDWCERLRFKGIKSGSQLCIVPVSVDDTVGFAVTYVDLT